MIPEEVCSLSEQHKLWCLAVEKGQDPGVPPPPEIVAVASANPQMWKLVEKYVEALQASPEARRRPESASKTRRQQPARKARRGGTGEKARRSYREQSVAARRGGQGVKAKRAYKPQMARRWGP